MPVISHRCIVNEIVLIFVLVTQLYLTLCDRMDCSSSASSIHGILQAESWSGLPFPSPGDLPNTGIEPNSPALQTVSLILLFCNFALS